MDNFRWPRAVPADWLVLTMVGSGFIAILQYSFGREYIPVQTVAVAMFFGLVLVALAAPRHHKYRMPVRVRLPMTLFATSVLIAFAHGLWTASSTGEAVAAFVFMYSAGLLLVVFTLVPITVGRRSGAFKVFCAVALIFGLIQALQQDLFLPQAYREEFGIVFDHFVNGNVRAMSFFASPPRFAELLVLMSSYVQYGFVVGNRRGARHIAIYAVILYALYNTYSRSGYVLFVATILVQLILMRNGIKQQGKPKSLVRLNVVLAMVGFTLALLIAGRIPLDSSVADSASLDARLGHWQGLIASFRDQPLLDWIIGSGRSAHFSFLSPDYFVLDNLLLAIFLYSGVLGLIGFIYLYGALFLEGLKASQRPGGALRWHPLLSFYLCLMLEGMLLDNHNTVFVTQFALMGMLTFDRLRAVSGKPVRPVVLSQNPAANTALPPKHNLSGKS